MTEEIEQTEEVFEIATAKKGSGHLLKAFFLCCVIGVLGLFAALYYLLQLNLPTIIAWDDVTFEVQDGDTVREIAKNAKDAGIVTSEDLLYLILATQFDATQIKASRYVFDRPLTTYEVAENLIQGDFDTDLVSITIFEGESRQKIADRLLDILDEFDTEEFMRLTQELEGTLYPDTYFVPTDFTTSELVTLLHDSYHQVVDEYASDIALSGYSESEIITLASIVEREANTEESMRYVAGIFNNRLNIGMALQADASIEYVLDEGLNELAPGELAQNLREFDSPYNTYLYPGLPPTPIGNPGKTAIEAVIFPLESDYFYYITGDDGEFYYAETYNGHLRNINEYLR